MNKLRSTAEMASELNIWNLCYYFFHRDEIRARLKAGNEVGLPIDTIAGGRPEIKKENDNA